MLLARALLGYHEARHSSSVLEQLMHVMCILRHPQAKIHRIVSTGCCFPPFNFKLSVTARGVRLTCIWAILDQFRIHMLLRTALCMLR